MRKGKGNYHMKESDQCQIPPFFPQDTLNIRKQIPHSLKENMVHQFLFKLKFNYDSGCKCFTKCKYYCNNNQLLTKKVICRDFKFHCKKTNKPQLQKVSITLFYSTLEEGCNLTRE